MTAQPAFAPTFALLDDRDAVRDGSGAAPASRLYTGFVREHRCIDPSTLDDTWRAVEADQRAGLHALLLADYEWGAKLLRAGHAGLAADDRSSLRVLMFASLQRLARDEVDAWLQRQEGSEAPGVAGTMRLEASVDEAAFTQAIGAIHEAIAAGETYQVNYTYRLNGSAFGSPIALYRRLRARQPVSYGALIALPSSTVDEVNDEEAVRYLLSSSPELFLRHTAGTITARPMKGTAPRIAAPESDSETARLLSLDTKNRAENLMIVDLLRNDLGRIAQTGSVSVPSLFAIEPYTTVFQMTSTVQARLRPEIDMPALLRATFPCGSITGAPKHHTMELIAGLESTPRGAYCGAIGWVDAPVGDARCGDFCLSVAIRTLTLGAERDGLRPARLGVGAGIVQDSVATDEFEECRLKARYLTGLDPGFELFETMRGEGGAVPHATRHLDRLERSAKTLGFVFDRTRAARELAALVGSAAPTEGARLWRIRLALAHDGRMSWTHAALSPLPDDSVGLLLSPVRLPASNPLALHKTTHRAVYDEGWRAAEREGAFDSLFFSRDGRLLEGGRSSVFVKLDGRWWTPPLVDEGRPGVLPSVMRAVLLADPALGAAERRLTLRDLQRAEDLIVCNALRGALPARVLHLQPLDA